MDRLRDVLAQDMGSKGKGASGKSGGVFDLPGDVYGTPDGRIVVIAKSIKRALERASDVLEESIMNLDYEILEHGSRGFLGMGSKPYKLVVGVAQFQTESYGEMVPGADGEVADFNPFQPPPPPRDVNGAAKLVVRKSGIYFVVNPPKGAGKPATLEQANTELLMRGLVNFDKALVEKAVNERNGEPVRLGDWQPNPQFDSKVSLEITPDEMKVFAIVTKPEKFGRVLEVEDIVANLELKGVKFGIMEDGIRKMLDDEIYNTPTLVAQGKPVEDGTDAVITYNFRTENEQIHLKEEEGRVDYHNLEKVQNVVVGQVLAVKEPATAGSAGRTVTNRRLEPKPGVDAPLIAGKNARLSEDGLEVTSEINGQVVFHNNKINVEPVFEVRGDVNLETGNIVFLGTVIVGGNVEDGFSVKAAGNVEVHGTVGKAVIEAEGNVIVNRGILGKDEAVIKAGNDIVAKFVEHTKLSAGNDVIVAEAIMHSFVDAGKRVVCVGKRAMIVGGRIRAREEVNAKEIGSKVSTETVVEVGIDPKAREELNSLEEEKREAMKRLDTISKDIITLQNQKGGPNGVLPEEKENMLQSHVVEKGSLEARVKEINEETEEIRSYLNMLQSTGKICASKMVHPGAIVFVKDARLEVKDNFKFVTFVQENGNIKINPYEEPEKPGVGKSAGGKK